MSTHLRHCPKHRLPLPCRHCTISTPTHAPATLAAASEPAASTPAESLPEIKRPDRPKLHADDNERKLASKRKRQEPKRQHMIARILAKARKHMSKVRTDITQTARFKKIMEDRDYLIALRADLEPLTYVELKVVYDNLVSRKAIGDHTGRLPGERSGEAPQTGGMSEIEKIDVALNVDEGGAEVIARSSKPSGHGPTSDASRQDAMDEGETSTRTSIPLPDDWYAYENRLEAAALLVAERDWKGPEVYEYKRCESVEELAEHVLARYREKEKAVLTRTLYDQIAIGEGAPRLGGSEYSRYYVEVAQQEDALRTAEKAKGKKARKITRLAREARETRITSPPTNLA